MFRLKHVLQLLLGIINQPWVLATNSSETCMSVKPSQQKWQQLQQYPFSLTLCPKPVVDVSKHSITVDDEPLYRPQKVKVMVNCRLLPSKQSWPRQGQIHTTNNWIGLWHCTGCKEWVSAKLLCIFAITSAAWLFTPCVFIACSLLALLIILPYQKLWCSLKAIMSPSLMPMMQGLDALMHHVAVTCFEPPLPALDQSHPRAKWDTEPFGPGPDIEGSQNARKKKEGRPQLTWILWPDGLEWVYDLACVNRDRMF